MHYNPGTNPDRQHYKDDMRRLNIGMLCLVAALVVGCSPDSSAGDRRASETTTFAPSVEATGLMLPTEVTPFAIVSLLTFPTTTPNAQTTQLKPATDIPPVTETPTRIFPTASSPLTEMPNTHLQTKCLSLLPNLPDGLQMNGTVVVGEDYGKAFLLETRTWTKIPLPMAKDGYSVNELHVSPDHKWLAYRAYRAEDSTQGISQLVVAAADGLPKEVVPWDNSWTMLSGWLDNERLLISREKKPTYPPTDSLVVFNPFTKQNQELSPDYPNIYYCPTGFSHRIGQISIETIPYMIQASA